MKRLVVIATVRRGPVRPPEPVSEELEAAMWEREYAESGAMDARVRWQTGPVRRLPKRNFEPRAKVERLMELARKTG